MLHEMLIIDWINVLANESCPPKHSYHSGTFNVFL